jgi:CRP/FNR family transcriptional regulator, nitrogen fixation regulation protein
MTLNPTTSATASVEFCHALQNVPHALQCLDSIAKVRRCRIRQELCQQGQAGNIWYLVLSGALSCCIIKSDGRRQIIDLLFPGDFSAFPGGEYDYTVEAIASGTIVASYPRKRVEIRADSNPEFARDLREVAFAALSRRQEQLLIVGRITVTQKVGAFILAMADRLPQSRANRVTLPLSRYDIADYLAVSAETVSRALSDLKQRGLIRFTGTRDIQIIDREALEDGERASITA